MKKILLFSLGAISTLILSHTFAKNESPEPLVVQTTLSSVLFKNCGNELLFNLPEDAEINYSCTGAIVIRDESYKNRIKLVPETASTLVTLTIEYNGELYTQKYKAVDIPAPSTEIKSDAKIVDTKTGVMAPGPLSLSVSVKANSLLRSFYPMDSRYKVTEWSVILVRGKRPVAMQSFKTDSGNLSSFQNQATAGDRIMIEITQVSRTNFQGKTESMPFNSIYNIPLN